jgi:beta-glucanase (GH16 family)
VRDAFWLLPEVNSCQPELDVMEMIGNQPNELVTTVHSQVWGSNELSSTHFDTGAGTYKAGMTTGFHTYGVDWEPNTITWYFDVDYIRAYMRSEDPVDGSP